MSSSPFKALRNSEIPLRVCSAWRVHSSAEDMHFYKEPHAILGGDLTSTAKSPMDTSGGLEAVASGVNPEEEVVDKEIELEEEVGQATGSSSGVVSQDFFLTPEGSSQSQDSSSGAPEAGEGSSDEGQLLHTSGVPPPDKEVNEE